MPEDEGEYTCLALRLATNIEDCNFRTRIMEGSSAVAETLLCLTWCKAFETLTWTTRLHGDVHLIEDE